jgi:AcrR family transcriptional regulator
MSPPDGIGGAASGRRRRRNPQGQGSRLRAELVAAADQILARTGDLEGLSLRAVAREVGIATPSIYLHFPDKSALVRAVLSARFVELGEAIRAAVVQATGPAEQLRAGCLTYCRFATEHPNAYRVLFGRVHPAGEMALTPRPLRGANIGFDVVRSTIFAARRADVLLPRIGRGSGAEGYSTVDNPGAAAFGLLVDSVSACMRAGIAPSRDPFHVATNVWTALHGIVSLRGGVHGFPWPPLDQQIDDVLAGMVGLHHNPPATKG